MQTQTDNGQPPTFNPRTSPVVLLPDQKEKWATISRTEPLTFEAAATLIAEAAAEDGRREDVGAGALDKLAVSYDDHGQLVICKTEQVGDRLVPASTPFPLRKRAFHQLCERANAPADYMARLPAMLTKACLSHGLMTTGADKTGLIRLADGQARAIVGARYAVLDDAKVMEVARTALAKRDLLGGAVVRAVAVGNTMVLRLSWPEATKIEVRSGDVLERGIDITNGELGNRSVGVAPMIWRLLCTNGLRSWGAAGAKRMSHIGDEERLYEMLVDAVPVALNETFGLVDAMRVAADRMLDNVEAEFDRLSNSYGLTSSEVRGVASSAFIGAARALPASLMSSQTLSEALRETQGWSVYDMVNGITSYAQERGTDRRLELEEVAGSYLVSRTR